MENEMRSILLCYTQQFQVCNNVNKGQVVEEISFFLISFKFTLQLN